MGNTTVAGILPALAGCDDWGLAYLDSDEARRFGSLYANCVRPPLTCRNDLQVAARRSVVH